MILAGVVFEEASMREFGLKILVGLGALGAQFVASPVLAVEERDTLRGHPKAVEAIEKMIERFGGRDVWAKSKTIYVEYDGWRLRPNEPIVERAWRSFERPLQKAEYEGRSLYAEYAVSEDKAWVMRNGDVTELDESHLQNRHDRHPFGFYTSLHFFATYDPRINLDWDEENERVIVKSNDGVERGWWQVDGTGALIKWGSQASEDQYVEYVYGPMRPFGNINYPAWGAAVDGSWRWNYTEVDVSTAPFAVSTEMPG